MALQAQALPDLRFGHAPLPSQTPGYAPEGDARALMLPALASPARVPIAGVQYTGSYAADGRYVIRVPAQWNGSLVIAGTPAFRSEYAGDLVWSDFALAHGYAYAASNKGIPYNAIALPAAAVADRSTAYPVPFGAGGLLAADTAFVFGTLTPRRISVAAWNNDFRALVIFAQALLSERHAKPKRSYAVGLSNGGAQVRTLLERWPKLVDGGVDWAGVYWTPQASILDTLPPFLQAMPEYVAGGFRDTAIVARLVHAGFPPDVRQDDPAHPSLYGEYYSNLPPFYADITVFAYALLVDSAARSGFASPACTPHPLDPARLPARCNGSGLARAAGRANYVPSTQARAEIATFAHAGSIERPLISIAGTHDAFITPELHAIAYARAVAAAKRRRFHELLLVRGGTHVDSFAAFGYGLIAQAPFAWAALARLVRTVEKGGTLSGTIRTVDAPDEIA